MELVVQVISWEALAAALEVGVGGVALLVPRRPEGGWWSEAAAWQTAARRQGVKFYLVWDRLVEEGERPRALEMLAAAARMGPEALILRDLGICRQAARDYPDLPIHGAGSWGCHNSWGLRQAEALRFRRVVVEAPLSLKDLALMQRQSSLPLEVVLPPRCPGFPGLCLLQEYLGINCGSCGGYLAPALNPPAAMPAPWEMLPGLSRLGVEAVQVGGVFAQGESLQQIVRLYQAVGEASPAGGSQVPAAREVWAAWEESFKAEFKKKEEGYEKEYPGKPAARGGPSRPRPQPGLQSGGNRLWLEARGYGEAAALARECREPLVVQLTPENYSAFLPDHRRWNPRRLIWRLPPVIRESALSFFRKAMETLGQGGYTRFVAGDWGAVALARDLGGEVYGDQTLGVRNSWALTLARELGVHKICLPPGRRPEDWQELLRSRPRSFWGYLYHVPALTVWPREAASALPVGRGPSGEKLRWVMEGDLALLCKRLPEDLEDLGGWLQEQGVAPLVLALPRSGLPRDRVPALAARRSEGRGRPRV
jgi:collagenase-like PrtC family protease